MMMSLSCALLVHAGDEAALELLALLAGAELAARVDLCPGRLDSGSVRNLGAIAGLGGLLPLADDLEVGHLFESARARARVRRRRSSGGRRNWRGPSCSRRAAGGDASQERNVLEEELLLEILGAGGDHHALAGENRGDQVGQRLAGAGACLHDQMAFVGEADSTASAISSWPGRYSYWGARSRESPSARKTCVRRGSERAMTSGR